MICHTPLYFISSGTNYLTTTILNNLIILLLTYYELITSFLVTPFLNSSGKKGIHQLPKLITTLNNFNKPILIEKGGVYG